MKAKAENKRLDAVEEQSKRFFTGGEFHWSKSREAVWRDMESALGSPQARIIRRDFTVIKWVAAALVLVLLGVGGVMRYSSQTITTVAGEHQSITLPDGSIVEINAQSSLEYKPYWWRFDRNVKFEGEAFFSVEKGKRFRVISKAASTEVLGTRFSIYARDEVYRVTCVEGSVKVTSIVGDRVVLKANEKASLNPGGSFLLQTDIDPLPEISWKDYSFYFTAVPLIDVFSEIERQYGVKIDAKVDLNALYTGNFSKNQNVEEVLGYICPAMGYKYIRQSATAYSIIPDPQ